ncbi:MAG: TIGR01244 family sulfur transferase [Allosphingosinicella sp.]|uniref:TIGR01244 family sulfur transferase n=1 Tax=Allosphingosinicella sp. TaxID=2823234 RepID=UPI00393C1110
MRRLENGMFVDGQISPDDVPGLAAQGIALIVNNRPDGEEPGQPGGAEIEAAAEAAGIAYRFIPISQLTPEAIEATREALDEAKGPVLAFCKSGTRSTYVWALARSLGGADGDTLVGQATEAGYDLTPIRRFLR